MQAVLGSGRITSEELLCPTSTAVSPATVALLFNHSHDHLTAEGRFLSFRRMVIALCKNTFYGNGKTSETDDAPTLSRQFIRLRCRQ
jgi:hypothetical protein